MMKGDGSHGIMEMGVSVRHVMRMFSPAHVHDAMEVIVYGGCHVADYGINQLKVKCRKDKDQ
jgi:hypothetical protein